jgi:hypothetical protein
MEHNLAKYAKYYSCGCTQISGSNEFTKETNHSQRIFLDIGKQMLEISYILNFKQLLEIALKLNRYLWQKLKLEKLKM